MCTNSKATPINDNDYSCHNNSCRTCLTKRMESISRHITLLVINSLGGGDTHTQTHTHTHTHKRPQRKAASACAWFKNYFDYMDSALLNDKVN